MLVEGCGAEKGRMEVKRWNSVRRPAQIGAGQSRFIVAAVSILIHGEALALVVPIY